MNQNVSHYFQALNPILRSLRAFGVFTNHNDIHRYRGLTIWSRLSDPWGIIYNRSGTRLVGGDNSYKYLLSRTYTNILNIFEYIKIKSHTQLQSPPLINKEQGKYWLFHIVTINRALDHWPNKPCTFEGALVPLWLNNPRISENPFKLVLKSRYYVVSLLLHRQRWGMFIRAVQLVFTTICNDPTR